MRTRHFSFGIVLAGLMALPAVHARPPQPVKASVEALRQAPPEWTTYCGLVTPNRLMAFATAIPQPDDVTARCQLLSRADSSTYVSHFSKPYTLKLGESKPVGEGNAVFYEPAGRLVKGGLLIRIGENEMLAPVVMDMTMTLFSSSPTIYGLTKYPAAKPAYYFIKTHLAVVVYDLSARKFCSQYLPHAANESIMFFEIDRTHLMSVRFQHPYGVVMNQVMSKVLCEIPL